VETANFLDFTEFSLFILTFFAKGVNVQFTVRTVFGFCDLLFFTIIAT